MSDPLIQSVNDFMRLKFPKKGRVFKFTPSGLGHSSIDEYMNNEALLRNPFPFIHISPNKIKQNSLNKNDYIFIQFKGRITHYVRCVENINTNTTEICFKNLIKLRVPLPPTPGQGYTILNDEQITNYLELN